MMGTLIAAFAAPAHRPPAAVDAEGNLRVPPDYRTAYEFLGTWAVAADKDPGSKQMHDVYATPGTISAFRKTGRFPDGTLLIKEVYESTTASMTTGTVSHAQTLKGWFVMMKDSKNSYPDNKLWGEGWGWSWFDAGRPQKTTSTNYKTDCLSCHVPAQASDWIYTNGYPSLKKLPVASRRPYCASPASVARAIRDFPPLNSFISCDSGHPTLPILRVLLP